MGIAAPPATMHVREFGMGLKVLERESETTCERTVVGIHKGNKRGIARGDALVAGCRDSPFRALKYFPALVWPVSTKLLQ